MDKKNTLLLTVIAVATLLVAVVGATFAYFSVVNGNTTSTTTVTGSTPDVGTIAMEAGTTPLYLDVESAQMANLGVATNYYAMDSQITPGTSEQDHTFATVKVTGGDGTTKYYCKANVKVELPTDEMNNTMPASLQEGDAFIKFGWDMTEDPTGITKTPVDLKDILDETEFSEPKTVKFTLTGANDTATITGDVYLVNKTETQNDLKNKKLQVKVTVDGLTCDTKELSN